MQANPSTMSAESARHTHRTPSQSAFEEMLNSLGPKVKYVRTCPGDEPSLEITGPEEALEAIRRSAEAARLYAEYSRLMKSLRVFGFGETRPPLNLAQRTCDRCGDDLITTRDRMDGYCVHCRLAVHQAQEVRQS